MKKTIIISAFPGVGKSYLFRNSKLSVLDSDSSNYSWVSKGVRNSDFPNNYINHIKDNIGVADVILISSHKIVRDALVENGIDFTLVYPSKECKDEYLERYKSRGSDNGFISMIDSNWDEFINELDNQENCNKVILMKGEYLSNTKLIA